MDFSEINTDDDDDDDCYYLLNNASINMCYILAHRLHYAIKNV